MQYGVFFFQGNIKVGSGSGKTVVLGKCEIHTIILRCFEFFSETAVYRVFYWANLKMPNNLFLDTVI